MRHVPILAAILAAILAVAPHGASAVAGITVSELASPLDGPGVPELDRGPTRQVERGWRELVDGRPDKAGKRARKALPAAPARLLVAQIALVEGSKDAAADVAAVCMDHPRYAAAWVTLSRAAEASGDEKTALDAAARALELWPDGTRRARSDGLQRRWIVDRLAAAERSLAAGDVDDALALLDVVLALDATAQGAGLLKAEALTAAGRLEDAERTLDGLGAGPETILLRGRIAEQREDWQAAMESYAALPPDHPDRAEALDRTQTLWRLSVLPSHARRAMTAPEIDRGDLAVILVSVQPRLETLPGGAVPVMSDIVDHPGHREIVTVVRLGIMEADLRDHRFHPEGSADVGTVRRAVNRTAILLGATPPRWCAPPNVVGSGCLSMSSPPSGGAVVSAVLGIAPGADR